MNNVIGTMCVCLVFCLGSAGVCMAGPGYSVFVDGQAHQVEIGREYQVPTASGDTVSIRLEKNAVSLHEDEFLRFRHPGDLSLSQVDLGEGIRQLLVNTATGTMVLVQEYPNMNPGLLVPMMLSELTKEDREYGYRITEEPFSRTLADGKELKGLRARAEYQGEVLEYVVASYGVKDRGILLVTMMDQAFADMDKPLLDMVWESLECKF